MVDDKFNFRIKIKRYRKNEVYREDISRGFSRKGEHLFYVLSVPFEEVLAIYGNLEQKVQNSPLRNEMEISNLKHPEETEAFMDLYNKIFMAAPDPSRSITLEEAALFPEDQTFIARLWGYMAGFVYLVIEPDKENPDELVGAIAGIGILPKYRGKKLGLLLIKHSIDYFRDKGITKLVCEVYHENKASLNMFLGLGMKIVGHMILEEEQSG